VSAAKDRTFIEYFALKVGQPEGQEALKI